MGCLTSSLKSKTYDNTFQETYTFTKAKVVKVYDGDTVHIVGKHNGRYTRFRVRLYGIDCDELNSKDIGERNNALLAKSFVENRVLNKIVKIKIVTNTNYEGRMRKDKYGRLLGIIWYKGINLNEELLKVNLAKELFY